MGSLLFPPAFAERWAAPAGCGGAGAVSLDLHDPHRFARCLRAGLGLEDFAVEIELGACVLQVPVAPL